MCQCAGVQMRSFVIKTVQKSNKCFAFYYSRHMNVPPVAAPEIRNLPERYTIGKRMNMTLAADQTPALWQSFMPQKKNIAGAGNLISMHRYGPGYFTHFNPNALFEKWAAAEAEHSVAPPPGLETFLIPGGLYAGFLYRGLPQDFFATGQYIYTAWLPGSGYALDDRPHFFVMDHRYRHNDPTSEEEFWIPVLPK